MKWENSVCVRSEFEFESAPTGLSGFVSFLFMVPHRGGLGLNR
jgi:hypothetical protein